MPENGTNAHDRLQLFLALTLLVTVLFVASGYAPAARCRRPRRAAAIALFVLGLITALAEIILWVAELSR